MRLISDSQSETMRRGGRIAAMCVASRREMSSVGKDPLSGAVGSLAKCMSSIGSWRAWLMFPGSSHGTKQMAPEDCVDAGSVPWSMRCSQWVWSFHDPSVYMSNSPGWMPRSCACCTMSLIAGLVEGGAARVGGSCVYIATTQ